MKPVSHIASSSSRPPTAAAAAAAVAAASPPALSRLSMGPRNLKIGFYPSPLPPDRSTGATKANRLTRDSVERTPIRIS